MSETIVKENAIGVELKEKIAIAVPAAATPAVVPKADSPPQPPQVDPVNHSTPSSNGDSSKEKNANDAAAIVTPKKSDAASVIPGAKATTPACTTPATLTTTPSVLSSQMNDRYAPSRHADEDSDEERWPKKKRLSKNGDSDDENSDDDSDDDDDKETDANSNDEKTPKIESAALVSDEDAAKAQEKEEEEKKKVIAKNQAAIQMHMTPHGSAEQSWETVKNDAEELESLIFSIRRPSARKHLTTLSSKLKLLAAKLKRVAEVKNVLNAVENKTNIAGSKRSAGEMNDTKSSGDGSGNKKAKLEGRAIFAETPALANALALKSTSTSSSKAIIPASTSSNNSTQPPMLKEKDNFVQHNRFGSNSHCPDFDATGKCPLGTHCHHWHILRPRTATENIAMAVTNLTDDEEIKKVEKIQLKLKEAKNVLYSREDLMRAYEAYRKVTITRREFAEKIKADAFNESKYTLGFTCPIDKVIYYAQPVPENVDTVNPHLIFGGGIKSTQGIWWYKNMKQANEALATTVITDLIARGAIPDTFLPAQAKTIKNDVDTRKRASARAHALASRATYSLAPVIQPKNIAPVALPQINPWNWMEVDYIMRCPQFHEPAGCPLGINCRNAHVHYPKSVSEGVIPDLGALPRAFFQNFGLQLTDAFFDKGNTNGRGAATNFKTKSAVDSRSSIWYTAAWRCPHEGTIYYAAGGKNGKLNNQNMFLYPTAHDAKLAACGVVLDAWKSRGLIGEFKVQEVPPPPPPPPVAVAVAVPALTSPQPQPQPQPILNYGGHPPHQQHLGGVNAPVYGSDPRVMNTMPYQTQPAVLVPLPPPVQQQPYHGNGFNNVIQPGPDPRALMGPVPAPPPPPPPNVYPQSSDRRLEKELFG